MNDDAENLGCLAPDEAPRATDYIDQMQNMIGNLVNKGTSLSIFKWRCLFSG